MSAQAMTPNIMPANDDTVIHVRQWGTDSIMPLAGTGPVDLAPGVRLERRGEHWWVRADADRAVQVDGVYQRECQLRPASEIAVDSTLYIVETQRLVTVRNACRRLFGWQPEQLASADRAMRKIWLCFTRRATIVVRGDKDIVTAARLMHRALRGDSAPFMICSRHGHFAFEMESSPQRILSTHETLRAAEGGSLCIRMHDKPKDYDALTREAFRPDSSATLFLCAVVRSWQYETLSEISLPPFRNRIADRARVITEYAEDAARRLGASSECFGSKEHGLLLKRYSYSLWSIERAVDRMVVLNMSEFPEKAARQLRMDRQQIREWREELA